MKIDSLMYDRGNAGFYDDAFRRVLEDHVTFLRESSDTKELLVPESIAYRYVGDFYGLLRVLGVSYDLLWLTMRMAGMTGPSDDFGHLRTVRVPNGKVVYQIWQAWNTSQRVS